MNLGTKGLLEKLHTRAKANPLSIRVAFGANSLLASASTLSELEDVLERLEPYFVVSREPGEVNCGAVHAVADGELYGRVKAFFTTGVEEVTARPGSPKSLHRSYLRRRGASADFFHARESRTAIVCLRGQAVYVVSQDRQAIAKEMRRIIKDNILSRACERSGHAILHGAAAHGDSQGLLIAGREESGKTAVLLKFLLDHGWDFVTACKGFCDLENLRLTGWPEPVPVGYGVLDTFSLRCEGWDYAKREAHRIVLPYRRVFDALGAKTAPGTQLTRLILPRVDLAEPTALAPATALEAERGLLEACLSPRDPDQPHWLGYFDLDEVECDRQLRGKIAQAAGRIRAFRLTIGADFARYDLASRIR